MTKWMAALLSTFVVIGIATVFAPPPMPSEASRHADSTLGRRRGSGTLLTRRGYPICVSEAALDKGVSILGSGDTEAMTKYFNGDMGCVISREGVEVYVGDYVKLGVVRVRPKGETREFYTLTEAVAD
jgi:hypothetical protein